MQPTTLHQLTRRIAVALIIGLQAAHVTLRTLKDWSPPRKRHAILNTFNLVGQFGYCCAGFLYLVESGLLLRLGRRVVQGLDVDAVLWGAVLWSVGVGLIDSVGVVDEQISILQFWISNALTWAWLLRAGFVWVEKEGEVVQENVEEKEKGLEKEEMQEKVEVDGSVV